MPINKSSTTFPEKREQRRDKNQACYERWPLVKEGFDVSIAMVGEDRTGGERPESWSQSNHQLSENPPVVDNNKKAIAKQSLEHNIQTASEDPLAPLLTKQVPKNTSCLEVEALRNEIATLRLQATVLVANAQVQSFNPKVDELRAEIAKLKQTIYEFPIPSVEKTRFQEVVTIINDLAKPLEAPKEAGQKKASEPMLVSKRQYKKNVFKCWEEGYFQHPTEAMESAAKTKDSIREAVHHLDGPWLRATIAVQHWKDTSTLVGNGKVVTFPMEAYEATLERACYHLEVQYVDSSIKEKDRFTNVDNEWEERMAEELSNDKEEQVQEVLQFCEPRTPNEVWKVVTSQPEQERKEEPQTIGATNVAIAYLSPNKELPQWLEDEGKNEEYTGVMACSHIKMDVPPHQLEWLCMLEVLHTSVATTLVIGCNSINRSKASTGCSSISNNNVFVGCRHQATN
eukprot:Gb_32777 [translate_table: standard]